jgi:hypothetical protein
MQKTYGGCAATFPGPKIGTWGTQCVSGWLAGKNKNNGNRRSLGCASRDETAGGFAREDSAFFDLDFRRGTGGLRGRWTVTFVRG